MLSQPGFQALDALPWFAVVQLPVTRGQGVVPFALDAVLDGAGGAMALLQRQRARNEGIGHGALAALCATQRAPAGDQLFDVSGLLQCSGGGRGFEVRLGVFAEQA